MAFCWCFINEVINKADDGVVLQTVKGHQFNLQHFYVPTLCSKCEGLIWGVGYQGFLCQSECQADSQRGGGGGGGGGVLANVCRLLEIQVGVRLLHSVLWLQAVRWGGGGHTVAW